jgi:hypothetical protein
MRVSGAAKIDHIAAGGAVAALERLAGSDLIERGSVIIISVEAIRDRAGDRWPRKRADVWAFVSKRLDEHLSAHDIRHQVSETEFLVAMTSEEGVAAQAICLKILEEVLIFFLGAASPVDMRIRSVSQIDSDGIACIDLDPARIAVARRRAEPPPEPSPYLSHVDPAEEARRNPVSFVTSSGHAVRIDFSLEHVISLRHKVTAALRVEPTIVQTKTNLVVPARAFAKLSDEDVAAIDHATMEFGALFTTQPKTGRYQPPVVVPMSFRTMAGRKGRQSLVTAGGMRPEQVKTSVMVELIDVDRGTPEARLLEVAGLLGQISRAVFARLVPGRDATGAVRGARLQGLTLDGSDLTGTDGVMAGQLLDVARQAKGMSPLLLAQGLTSDGFVAVAEVAGFTHASLRIPPKA